MKSQIISHARYRICSLITLVFCISFPASGQSILSGDTSSPGIIYIDLDNLMVSAYYPWNITDQELIDINNDGIDDLKFWAMDDEAGHVSLQRSKIYGLNGAEIVYYEPQPSWVDEMEDGILIDSACLWSGDGILRYQEWYPDTIEEGGVFSSGYAGFRIPAVSGYMYGWVHLSASFTSIFIHDYAYQDIETGMHDRMDEKSIKLYPNPVSDRLNITLPEKHKFTEARICDGNGRLLQTFSVEGKENFLIDVSSYQNGIHIIQMIGNTTVSLKFLRSSSE